MTDITPQLQKLFGSRLKENEPLSKHTNFRIGGPAAFFARPKSVDEIGRVLAAAHRLSLPTLVVGGGTNLLVSDAGFDGLAVRVELGGISIDAERRRVTAGAGVPAKGRWRARPG